MLHPSGYRTQASQNLSYQIQQSPFWAAEACGTLEIFYSCTTWFLYLDDLVIINRTWLYKEHKVWVLQANAQLVQKG